MMQRMRRGWAYAAAHAAHHRPHPLGRLPACPPHTRRAAWHAAHGRRSCSATLATHMQQGGAPRSSWPPVTCATTHDAALEALLQARRTPSRASRNSMREPSASGGARPARDSCCSAAARETSRPAAPCDPGRSRRLPRVGAPQRRPDLLSQRGRARLILGARAWVRLK